MAMSEVDLEAVRKDCEERSERRARRHPRGAARRPARTATARSSPSHPIDALAAKVAEVDGREAIILTRPHVVAEFFHLDWTSRARRKIGVPVLHLLEHETFDEQAGGRRGRHRALSPGRHAGSAEPRLVGQLDDDVEVPGVPGVLREHVEADPLQRRRVVARSEPSATAADRGPGAWLGCDRRIERRTPPDGPRAARPAPRR